VSYHEVVIQLEETKKKKEKANLQLVHELLHHSFVCSDFVSHQIVAKEQSVHSTQLILHIAKASVLLHDHPFKFPLLRLNFSFQSERKKERKRE
jgi:hypothetical protein